MGKLTHTVSGRIASFKSADKANITHLKAHFLPIQEGEGDASPSNIRNLIGWNNGLNIRKASKNIAHVIGYSATTMNSPFADRLASNTYGTTINTTNYLLPDTSVSITQADYSEPTIASYKNGYMCIGIDNLNFNEYYDFSFKITDIVSNPLNASLSNIRCIAPSGGQKAPDIINGNVLLFRNFQWKQNTGVAKDRCTFEIRICGMSFTLSEFMVTPSNISDGAFESYSGTNIPVIFPDAGKNLLSPFNKGKGVNVNTGIESDMSGVAVTDYIHVDFSTNSSYYLSGLINTYHSFVAAYNSDKIFLGRCGGSTRSSLEITTSIFTAGTPQGTGAIKYLRVEQYNITDMSDLDTAHMQLEVGSSATAYEPFEYLCYGGYVDPITGDVYQEWRKVKITNFIWNNYSGKISYYANLQNDLPGSHRQANSYIYSDTVPMRTDGAHLSADAGQMTYYGVGTVSSSNKNSVWIMLPEAMEKDDAKAYVDELYPDAYLCYKLETPIYVTTLTPQQLQAFAGQNNIWNDTNGDTEVEYEFTDYMNKRRISLNEPHIITKSGGVGSFWTDLKAPIESLKVGFSPIQEGTGDPSLSNVRPVTGSTSMSVIHCHKNLLDPALKKWSNIYDVQKWGMDKAGSVANGELILPAGTYTLSISGLETGVSPSEWSIKDKDGNYFAHYYAGHQSATFTLSQAQAVGIYMSIANTENNRYCLHNRVMLEHGSSATSFEEYSAETIPVSWSSLGEILGGYVDLITGEVYKTWQKVNIGQYPNAWGVFNSSTFYTTGYMSTYTNPWNGGNRKAGKDIYCNMIKPVNTQNPVNDVEIGYFKTDTRYPKYLFMSNNGDVRTISEFKDWFGETYADAYIVYELEDPIFVGYIDPIAIKSFIGENVFRSVAGGDVTVKYWGHN